MRKFLAIFVVLALIAPAVFAVDFWFGGRVQMGLIGDTAENSDGNLDAPTWRWNPRQAGFNASATNDANTAGAKVGFGWGANVIPNWAYAWWRPFEQLYLKVGKVNEDGTYWNGDNYLGWGLNANDVNDMWLGPYAMTSGGAYYQGTWWNGFAGDMVPNGSTGSYDDTPDGENVQLTVLPIDGAHLTIRWHLPKDTELMDPLMDKISIQAKYAIPGAGDAWISFKNGPEEGAGNRPDMNIGVGYSMGLGNGMGFEVLLNVPGIGTDGDLPGIKAGVGFGMGNRWGGGFMGEPFQFRARLGSYIGLAEGEPTIIGLDLAPTYDLGIFRAFLHAGFSIGIPSEGDSIFNWIASPYLVKDLGGVCTLWTGASLWSSQAGDKDIVNYSIPFIIQFSL